MSGFLDWADPPLTGTRRGRNRERTLLGELRFVGSRADESLASLEWLRVPLRRVLAGTSDPWKDSPAAPLTFEQYRQVTK